MMAPPKNTGLSLDDVPFAQAVAKKANKADKDLVTDALPLKEERDEPRPLANKGDGIRVLRRTNQKGAASSTFTVVLDAPTKERLELASFENKVKMTAIARAAIDKFLRENGY